MQGQLNLYTTDALGRLYTVHPNNAECFYLRLLLINVRGPTSFQEIRTERRKIGLIAPNRSICTDIFNKILFLLIFFCRFFIIRYKAILHLLQLLFLSKTSPSLALQYAK